MPSIRLNAARLGLFWALCCLLWAAPAAAMTMVSAGDFSDAGLTVTDGDMALTGFGGASATFLEFDPLAPLPGEGETIDHLSWSHAFVLPSGYSLVDALLTIFFADDANDATPQVANEPEIGKGTLDDGTLLFGENATSVLFPGPRQFAIDPAKLAGGAVGVTVGNLYGDAYVTGARLELLLEELPPPPSAVPVPPAGLLLGAALGAVALRKRR